MIEDYLGGASLQELARKYNKTHRDVAEILRLSGVKIRPRGRHTTPARDLARSMLRHGLSPTSVSKATGLTRDAVLGIRWSMRQKS